MKKYYLNNQAQKNDDHEVHAEDCLFLPNENNRIYLGLFYSCKDAVEEAKSRYPNVKINGCSFCSKECHTS